MNINTKVRTFAVFNFFYAALALLGFVFLCVKPLLLAGWLYPQGGSIPMFIIGYLIPLALAPAIFFASLSAGIGLFEKTRWGYKLHILASVLIGFTLIGIPYTIFAFIFAFKPEFKTEFFAPPEEETPRSIMTAEPSTGGRSYYTIFEHDFPVAELKVSSKYFGGETAELTVGGYPYKFSSEGQELDGYELEENGKVLAFADDSVFKKYPGTIIQRGGFRYQLKEEPVPWHKRSVESPFILLRGNKKIGSVRWRTKEAIIDIDLPEKMPIFFRVFIFWIVTDQWRKRRATASLG